MGKKEKVHTVANEKNWKVYSATAAGYEQMLADLRDFTTAVGLSAKRQLRLELGFEEAAVNIISYAYVEPGDIYMCLTARSESIVIELLDYGEPFNPLTKRVTRAKELAERELGGLGIDLMRRTFLLMEYSYDEFRGRLGNHLTLIFAIDEKE